MSPSEASDSGATERGLPGAALAAVVSFTAGAAVLSLEITGARLFTPWFGASVLVWANVIGVTLGALAVGSFLGGRLADRRGTSSTLVVLLLLAAALIAVAPWVVTWVAERYRAPDLELASSYSLLARTSLLCAIVTLAPPLVLLGAIVPLLVRSAARSMSVGRASGLMSAAGTVGSLLGTFLPVYLLIPSVGSRATCWWTAAALATAATVVAIGGSRSRAQSVVAVCAMLTAAWFALGTSRSVGHPATAGSVREEIETRYQYARVEDDGQRVLLKLNEGLDSFHSVTVKGAVLTGGAYFDYYSLLVPPVARSGGEPTRVLILGFAAGTIARQMLALFEGVVPLEITGVELDGAVAALGEKHFELPKSERLRVVTDVDGRTFVDGTDEAFDLIVVDTYSQQVYVPFQMCSLEFFRAARDKLRPGGLLAANLSGFSSNDAPIRAISATAAAAFERPVGLLRVAEGRNFVMVCAHDRDVPEPGSLSASAPSSLASICDSAVRPGAWRVHRPLPGDVLLTDDCSPIELIADRDLFERSERLLDEARKS